MHATNRPLKQLFHTVSEDNRVQPVLSIKLSDKSAGFSVTNKQGNLLYQLSYCSVNEWTDEEMDNFFSSYPELEEDYYQVLISYAFRKQILVPAGSYRKNDGGLLMSSLLGISGGSSVVSEAIPEWQLYNVYAVPDTVHDRLRRQFPKATFRHQQSLELRNTNAGVQHGSIQVDFATEDFSVLVVSQSKLLFSGSFEYVTPADVLYQLLRVCRYLSLSQQDVQLQLSGLIDSNSALYKELYLYFIHIEFREATWSAINEYPAHFFTSLNDLAQCAL